MKVSIITPVLNDPRVGRALDSILSQRHEHELESIVIDGGSTDGTLDVLHGYRDRLAVLVSEPDGGLYEAMNKGIGRATGEVVGILNADDEYSDPFVLRDVLAAFADEAVDAFYGDLVYVAEAGSVVRYWRSGPYRRLKWYFGWAPPHPTFFARRRVYERYGAFDTGFPVAADYELMLRMLFRHRIGVRYRNRVLVNMAPGGRAIGSLPGILKAKPELARAWRRNGLRGGWFVPALRLAGRPLQFIRPLRRPPSSPEEGRSGSVSADGLG